MDVNFKINIHPYVSPYYSIGLFINRDKIASFRLSYNEVYLFLMTKEDGSNSRFKGCGSCMGSNLEEGLRPCGKVLIDIQTLTTSELVKLILN